MSSNNYFKQVTSSVYHLASESHRAGTHILQEIRWILESADKPRKEADTSSEENLNSKSALLMAKLYLTTPFFSKPLVSEDDKPLLKLVGELLPSTETFLRYKHKIIDSDIDEEMKTPNTDKLQEYLTMGSQRALLPCFEEIKNIHRWKEQNLESIRVSEEQAKSLADRWLSRFLLRAIDAFLKHADVENFVTVEATRARNGSVIQDDTIRSEYNDSIVARLVGRHDVVYRQRLQSMLLRLPENQNFLSFLQRTCRVLSVADTLNEGLLDDFRDVVVTFLLPIAEHYVAQLTHYDNQVAEHEDQMAAARALRNGWIAFRIVVLVATTLGGGLPVPLPDYDPPVPDFDLPVPDIDIPDIDIPVPDIDIPDFGDAQFELGNADVVIDSGLDSLAQDLVVPDTGDVGNTRLNFQGSSARSNNPVFAPFQPEETIEDFSHQTRSRFLKSANCVGFSDTEIAGLADMQHGGTCWAEAIENVFQVHHPEIPIDEGNNLSVNLQLSELKRSGLGVLEKQDGVLFVCPPASRFTDIFRDLGIDVNQCSWSNSSHEDILDALKHRRGIMIGVDAAELDPSHYGAHEGHAIFISRADLQNGEVVKYYGIDSNFPHQTTVWSRDQIENGLNGSGATKGIGQLWITQKSAPPTGLVK